MQFLLFDLSATLVFLTGYLTVVTVRRRRVSVVLRPGREPGRSKPAPTREDCQSCLEWPRLSAPR